ncbi:MAG: phosphoenolpyruvate--protein phosphotransferase [Bacillota bacterium]|nr:phosphoenolpyruvate--protein phosphotransferase [Bacillota bacterium]
MNLIPVSKGIGIGNALIIEEFPEIKEEFTISSIDEIKRLSNGINKTANDIKILYTAHANTITKKEVDIFKAHEMMLKDPVFEDKIVDLIKTKKFNAPYAVKLVMNEYVSLFENMDNEYFRERALDMKDIGKRLIAKLLDIGLTDFSLINNKTIIIAKELTPSDIIQLDKNYISGIITEEGGETSHVAIIANTMSIPGIMGATDITKKVKNNDLIIIDGSTGELIIEPNQEIIDKFILKRNIQIEEEIQLKEMIGKETITLDGKIIELSANIAGIGDIENVIENDAEGVGLFRSEFIYMDRNSFPTEEEQFNIYKIALQKNGNRPLIIRTMDIGGDKTIDYLNIEKEANPFLGYRAIRYCLDNEDVFKTQLRALLRASIYGNLKIMFPMISSMKELRKVKLILKSVKKELKEKKCDYSNNIEIGIMIEVPSAAIMADKLATEVDFFSIGTNDLIQYLTATDRMNGKVKDLYTPYHPAVLRTINNIIKAGHDNGIWVGMCGAVASNEKLIPLLLGMGLDEFSMSPNMLLKSRKIINNINIKEMKLLVEKVLNQDDSKKIEEFL